MVNIVKFIVHIAVKFFFLSQKIQGRTPTIFPEIIRKNLKHNLKQNEVL